MPDINLMLDNLSKEFSLGQTTLNRIVLNFLQAMADGLSSKSGPLKMLPSYLKAPQGSEYGTYLTLDFGGTNIRISLVELHGGGRFTVHKRHQALLRSSFYDYTSADTTAEELFDFIAGEVSRIAPPGKTLLLGHTFSFPSCQFDINNAKLIKWTKEIQTAGVEGANITELLTASLQRCKLDSIRPVAIINDTVSTLLAAAYSDQRTAIGSICGTGHNTAYIENYYGSPPKTMLINMESGNFNQLPLTEYDFRLDAVSAQPGKQQLEKCVAGRYIGELLRLILLDFIKSGFLTSIKQYDYITTPYSITAQDLSGLINNVPIGLNSKLSQEERKLLRAIAGLITKRSAQLVAASFCAVLRRINPDYTFNYNIAIDGSLFEKMPGYAAAIRKTLNIFDRRLSDKTTISLIKDGSGIGAAIAAAIASSHGLK